MNTRFDESARWLVVERGPISVACNLGAERQRVPIRARRHVVLLASETGVETIDTAVLLPPEAVAVLKTAD